ncbi:calcium-binding protein [Acuticoccus sp. MNP-M23]|uniref:calcium-binding protein n=1 Tax=Acuticoccus sp. MNP-M23 TaxID=3072793 RepID=UPI002814CBC0|nr:calcium-binding protein [Acuticoccus sp. MNP-M23]WMS44689.1 calcium-binding protein [Acuticoccus sp. MNP-M23]
MPTNTRTSAKVVTKPVTVLDIDLSADLQSTLNKAGTNAYAVFFDEASAGKPIGWTTLVDNGVVQGGGKASLTLTETVGNEFVGMNGGKVYILIQSEHGAHSADLQTAIKTESDINPGKAKTLDFRFDSIEVTLLGQPADAGNLTSVNGFGIPMELSVDYNDGTSASVGYKVSGADMFDKIATATNQTPGAYKDGPLKGEDRAVVSPSESVAEQDGIFKLGDWLSYIKEFQRANTGVEIAGFFNGAPDAGPPGFGGVWHNSSFFAYRLEWDAAKNVFWLSPTESSLVKGFIQLTEKDLANSIYSTLGNVGVYETKDSDPYQILYHDAVKNSEGHTATMNSGANNQWGTVLTQMLTGFSAGYLGQHGKSVNGHDTGRVDLSKNWNWDPTYAFGDNLYGAGPKHMDTYSQVFFNNSNSYGSNYSDALMSKFSQGGPQIGMSNPGNGQNVKTISLKLFDDGETPTGYVTPKIDNYLSGGADGYTVPAAVSGNVVSLNLANATMVVADGTRISLDIMTKLSADGTPTWQTVEFKPAAKGSLWDIWDISLDGSGTYAAKATGKGLGPGQMQIQGFPGTEAGTYWSRITIGDGGSAKTFNLYTEVAKNGEFVNPLGSKHPDSLAIDGLAELSPQMSAGNQQPDTIPTFGVNFMYSTSTTIAPEYLVYNDAAMIPTTPSSAVVGTIAHGDFKAIAGQDAISGSIVDTTAHKLAFGWTGENDAAGTRDWISAYTNKIGALNFAEINFSDTGKGGPKVAPIHTTADLDGQWVTGATSLANGTYTVTMSEYLSTDRHLKNAIGNDSAPMTVKVGAAELSLRPADGGTELRLAGGGKHGPDGNWVTLSVEDSPREAGKSVLVYLVDARGRAVDAKTLKAGVSIEDAVVATIGAHHHDDGTLVFGGRKTAYLPADLRFAFATLSGDGAVETDGTKVSRGAAGTADVTIDGYTLHARTDNHHSSDEVLASAQRATGAPVVYLEAGTYINVDATGSTDQSNRLAFVRMDISADTGIWSVDGVAYGETDAFRDAVRANLDGGFNLRGSGDFTQTTVWDLAGETGYYAPMLITADGEIIIAPRTLGDNIFAFDDEAGQAGADNDFNDMTARLSFLHNNGGPVLSTLSDKTLVVEGRGVVRADGRFVSTFDGDNGDFPGTAFGVSVVGDENDASRFVVAGDAVFRGGSNGVVIESDTAVVKVREGGSLSLRPGPDGEPNADDSSILHVRGANSETLLHNSGLIKGAVSLGAGDDLVGGDGRFDGPVDTGGGDDRFNFRGDDALDAVALGGGDDRFRTATAAATVNGGSGDDLVLGGAADDALSGGNGNDTVRGGGGDDLVRGGNGDDFLDGGRGRDTLEGGNGDDRLHAGAGGGTMDGGAGADILRSGRGNDDMTGGEGADEFIIGLLNGNDTILDFENGRDRIDLSTYGREEADFLTDLYPALSEAGGDAIRIDLSVLGGTGSVVVEGLSFDTLNVGDFIF